MRQGNVTERKAGPPDVGVSVVIFALAPSSAPQPSRKSDRDELWLPLVRRVREPFNGMWALPGGDLQAGRSLESSAYHALESTTQLRPGYLEQLYTFGDPDRSGAGLPMVSIVYWALIGTAEAGAIKDGINVRWFPESALPPLAFDHDTIVQYALNRLRSKMSYPDVASKLVGERFTLRRLHDVYEAISGQSIDLGNFRRKMLASGQLESTGEKFAEGRRRPAEIYRYAAKVAGQGREVWRPDGRKPLPNPDATGASMPNPASTDASAAGADRKNASVLSGQPTPSAPSISDALSPLTTD